MQKRQYEKLKLIREIQAAGRSLLKQNHGSDIQFIGYGLQEKKVAAEIMHKVSKKRPCAAYDKDGMCIGVADSVDELAKMLHVHRTTISKNISSGNGRYAYVTKDEEDGA